MFGKNNQIKSALPASSSLGRLRFNELPDDVLVTIFSQCRIDELLQLRLTNRKSRDLISRYISTIAPSVARQTFPESDHLLRPLENPQDYNLTWLKSLIPQHLAAILVDRHRYSHEWADQRYGIPAEDPYGDKLRRRVASGWCMLRRLSKISEDVYNMNPRCVLRTKTDFAWDMVLPSRFNFAVFRRREEIILSRRLEYISGLSDVLARDYKLMFMLLSAVFRTSLSNYGDDYKPWIFDWGCGIDGQRLFRRGNSWLTWFVLHEGPGLFWNQWWSLDAKAPGTRDYIRDRSIKAWIGNAKLSADDFVHQFLPKDWEDVNEKWHRIHRDHARAIQKAMQDKAGVDSFSLVNPIVSFADYAELRLDREDKGIAPPKEILSGVPFHVEFRCPEELFQKFCKLREQGAHVITPPLLRRDDLSNRREARA